MVAASGAALIGVGALLAGIGSLLSGLAALRLAKRKGEQEAHEDP